MTLQKYTLPSLPYEYSELEPFIDTKTIKIHHTKHHQSYIDALNQVHESLQKARKNGEFSKMKHLKKDLSYNYSAHILHKLYWENMCPKIQCKDFPQGALFDAIEKKFISYGNFLKEFRASCLSIEGSGWGILVLIEDELEVLGIEKYQNLSIIGAIPLIVCDMFEHAYYLNYENKKSDYVDNFFNIINWDVVEKRYDYAKKKTSPETKQR